MSTFKDHFSGHSAVYARYRPRYPDALYAYLAACAPAHGLAWDCATGNGQAAVALAAHFEHVVATDASAEQIAHAVPQERIAYHVEPAERTSLESATVDLVTVAQALHWFDAPPFFAEVRRVLKPGGVVAAWAYSLMRVTPEVDAILTHYYRDIVGSHWPPERRVFDDAYAVNFPFPRMEIPPFELKARWNEEMVLGYLSSWSASQRYWNQHGADPSERIRADLNAAWGAIDVVREITWPLYLHAARVV